jgi:hypothetical protein
MPLRTFPDDQVNAVTRSTKRVTVQYVRSDKTTELAEVRGPGTTSGLKLRLVGKTILDNVAPATTYAQTGVYRYNSIA